MKMLIPTLALLGCTTLPQLDETTLLQSHHAVMVTTAMGSGSGFAINPTEVLTAWHVVQHSPEPFVKVAGRNPITITRLGNLDVAVLTFAEPHDLAVFRLRDHDAQPAERVYISGYGIGEHWWSSGFGTEDPHRLSLDIAPGDSGSPVYDSTGRVVGLLVGKGRHGNHHAWVVPVSQILSQLRGLPTPQATTPPLDPPHPLPWMGQ